MHRGKQRNIASILRFDRHLGYIDDLLFYQVLFVDKTQAPRLDELVGELPMKKLTALLDAPRDPRLKSRLRTEVVDVHLLQVIRTFPILLSASATVIVL